MLGTISRFCLSSRSGSIYLYKSLRDIDWISCKSRCCYLIILCNSILHYLKGLHQVCSMMVIRKVSSSKGLTNEPLFANQDCISYMRLGSHEYVSCPAKVKYHPSGQEEGLYTAQMSSTETRRLDGYKSHINTAISRKIDRQMCREQHFFIKLNSSIWSNPGDIKHDSLLVFNKSHTNLVLIPEMHQFRSLKHRNP